MEETQQHQAPSLDEQLVTSKVPKRYAAGIAERKRIDHMFGKVAYLIRMSMLICFGIGIYYRADFRVYD